MFIWFCTAAQLGLSYAPCLLQREAPVVELIEVDDIGVQPS
jgi:hypothetical protein